MGARDFDFLMGSWRVRNLKLRERLRGCSQWDEFEATSTVRMLLRGLGNEDEFETAHDGGMSGMSFRFFNPVSGLWAIYWADSRRGTLEAPVYGGFEGSGGVFEGANVFEGRPILVRFTWQRGGPQGPRWEQAFSNDDGRVWETNWIMEFTSLPD
ncbi:MAG: hypothetical protein V4508_18725 [Pseudomonadota bacterium]